MGYTCGDDFLELIEFEEVLDSGTDENEIDNMVNGMCHVVDWENNESACALSELLTV